MSHIEEKSYLPPFYQSLGVGCPLGGAGISLDEVASFS